jgi:SAM-dependent methyltransferase
MDVKTPDPFPRWLNTLDQRHRTTLNFQEVRRSVQALSHLYVERRNRIEQGSAFDGAGKRAAFATYFAPLHFLLVREIVRALKAGDSGKREILDLGCGTGIAGAAWALEMNPSPRVTAVDRNPWALREARWTYGTLGLRAFFELKDVDSYRIEGKAAIVAAFTINELSEEARGRVLKHLIAAARRGSPVLVIEPIARHLTPWWQDSAREWAAIGGRADEWRFPVQLPPQLELMDKAAGLDHRELTGRSLFLEIADRASENRDAEPEHQR